MKKVQTRVGDIFAVLVSDREKKFFQLIALNLTQLNSDVIRAFKERYPANATPDPEHVVCGEVEFNAHCVTSVGVKLGFWEKVGSSRDVGRLNHILFRDTNDYGCAPEEEPIQKSSNWHIWHIGDPRFTHVGTLTGDNRKAEIGLVFEPNSIVHRMKTGEYPWFYPDFD